MTVTILNTVKVVLAQMGLSSQTLVSIAGKKVPTMAIRITFIAVQLLHGYLQMANCFSSYNAGNITDTLTSFHFGLSSIVCLTVYSTLIWQIDEIMDLFDYIQHVVDERMK